MAKNPGVDLGLPVASWYRGLSLDQMQAADELGTALQFDIRSIRDCLLRLGVQPLIRNRELHRIWRFSRGQKLAFLYFLFQEHYDTSSSCGKYSVNGQLLLSAIAYLDLPATFRGLDKVLPLPGCGQAKIQLKNRQNRSARPSIIIPNSTAYSKNIEEEMPLDLPATFRALDKVLSSHTTKKKSSLRKSFYFQKQPRPKTTPRRSNQFLSETPLLKIQIPNEVGNPKDDEDRWFTDFQFHPIQRTVKAVINHELCHLFDHIDEVTTDLAQKARDLCEFHEETRTQERQAFLQEQRRRYLDMVDVEGTAKRLTRERILHHLNRDVDEYLLKFGDKGWSPGVPAFRKPGCVACSELVHVSLDTPPQVLLLEGKWGRLYDRSGALMRLCAGEDGEPDFLAEEEEEENSIAKPEYFTAPGDHKPFAFNYEQIFKRDSKQSLDTNDVVKNSLMEALSGQRNKLHQGAIASVPIRSSHINEAVSRCVRKIFEKSLLAVPTAPPPKDSNERLVYSRERIDPDDDKFMDQMLSDGFEVLRRDSKLVLASLHNGHQIPEVREWVCRRYGKRYGPQSLAEFESYRHNMGKLSEMKKKLIPLLTNIDPLIVKQNPIPYSLHKEIMEKSNKFKKSFREEVLQIVLKQSRLCWQAQHSLRFVNSSRIRRTFFTYLPSCPRSIDPTYSYFLAHNMCSYVKSSCSLLVLVLALGAVSAQPARLAKQLQKQQAAPYPSADELKPEVPFEEGVPDQTYGPPDLTYGPPPTDAVEQLPSDEEPQDFTPDPDAEEVQPIQQAAARLTKQIRNGPRAQGLILLSSSPLRVANSNGIPFPVTIQALW
ncbi:GM12983 [Drosophila sechellia]|uniref:GM12983 n=2 Tax=Drosophila sechellia TaxID=7238 RepID=B4HYK6_DROSE|nr:GM12983 [Drosophila sechellia]